LKKCKQSAHERLSKKGERLFFMTNLEIIDKLRKTVKEKPHEYQAVEDLFEMLRIYEAEDKVKAHEWNGDVRRTTARQVRLARSDSDAERFYLLNKRSLLFDAKYELIIEFDLI
jgi:hypothetical protein